MRRSGKSVVLVCAAPTRAAGGAVAGFGAGFTSVGARFATGTGAAGAATPADGGAGCHGSEDEGYEESAHTRGLSAG
jgi:hypothetical protein